MRQITIAIMILTVLWSCDNQNKKEVLTENNSGTENEFKTHQRLIDCKTKYVMEDGEEADGYHEDYESFIKVYFSEEQNGDTLIITSLIEVNACGKTIGDIEFSGDTLFLKTRQIADEVCASTMFERFTYKIHNPDKKKYEIHSER